MGELLCGYQPTAPTSVVWSWCLNECLGIKGSLRYIPCLVPRRLSLDENLRKKEGGKEKTGETCFASPLYPSHGPLHFVTSHSRLSRLPLFKNMWKTKYLRRRLDFPRSLADGYAMLMSPNKGETAVHGSHCPCEMYGGPEGSHMQIKNVAAN